MQKNSNRKGLALGAAFAMVASLFVGAAPASANTDGQYIAVTPAAGPVSNFNGLLNEDFDMISYLLPGVTNNEFASNKVIYEVTKTSGAMEVLITSATVSHAIAADADTTSTSFTAVATGSNKNFIQASSSRAVTVSGGVAGNGTSFFNVRAYTASGIVSSSPVVTLNIKVWIENPATTNGLHDSLEWFTTRTVTLHSTNNVPATTTIGSPIAGDKVLTVSATVGALNFQNLSGVFFLQVNSTANNFGRTGSGDVAATVSAEIGQTTMFNRAGVVSQSFVITQSAGIAAGTSVSAHVRYAASGNTADSGFRLGALASAVIAGGTAGAISVGVVEGDHAEFVSGVTKVRANQTYTFRVGVTSGSPAVSVSGAVLTAAITGPALSVNVKEISVNGAAATTSFPTALSLTTGTDGFATFTLRSSGFVDGDDFNITVRQGNLSQALAVEVEGANPVLTADASLVSTGVGASTPIAFSVKDQWDVATTRADLRVMITLGGTGFAYATTVSYVAVTNGVATFTYTPTPATRTGSATVTARLQELQSSTNTYVNVAGSANVVVDVNVTALADAHSAGPVVSQSSSVSYFPSTVSWRTITGSVVNAGALIEVSGPTGLVFRESSAKPTTASGKLTFRAGAAGAYSFQVASLLEKTHTVTIKVGSATTTSQLVVSAVSASNGVRIAFDKTSITAGETSVITGKLTDANGNPVNTTNTDGGANALLVVSWAGKGLPFNTGSSVETDENGEFKVNVLALAGDTGTGTLTATYRPFNTAVDTRNVSATQTINIVAPAAPAAPEVNAVIGSFNGRVAVRVENAKGAAVSVKIGARWFKYTSLNDNYLFTRKSVTGRTLPVAVYVNGTLENVATITVK